MDIQHARRNKKCLQIYIQNTEWKKPIGTRKFKCDNNVKIHI